MNPESQIVKLLIGSVLNNPNCSKTMTHEQFKDIEARASQKIVKWYLPSFRIESSISGARLKILFMHVNRKNGNVCEIGMLTKKVHFKVDKGFTYSGSVN